MLDDDRKYSVEKNLFGWPYQEFEDFVNNMRSKDEKRSIVLDSILHFEKAARAKELALLDR
ncbi:MAG: hypothetical protein J7647_21505 [Cyanobacteria bacterium SBLK]|nr:hypothetical protein [Cyanobacteria bacterium SBLK]